jgi:acetyl esterase/lipase
MPLRRTLAAACLLAIALAGGRVAAQAPAAPAPPPAAAFFQNPAVLSAELSPSGRQLAVSTAIGTGRVGLAVFELGETIQSRRVALFNDADIVRFRWVGDRQLVFSIADLAQGSGEDRYAAPGLYAVDADGTGLRQLVQRRVQRVVTRAGPLGRDPLPWHHQLLQVPRPGGGAGPDEVIVGDFHFSSGNDLEQITPRWLDVRSGRTRSMDLQVPRGAQGWWFDSRGEARAVVTRSGGTQALLWRAPGQADWKKIAEGPLIGLPHTPRFVDDEGTLIVSHAQGREGQTVLSRFDFGTGRPEPVPWVSTPGFDFEGSVIPRDDGQGLAGVRSVTDAETTTWMDPAAKALQALADARLPGRVNRLSCRRCSAPDAVALVQSWSDRDPGQLWLYQAQDKQWRRVALMQPGIVPAQMASVDFQRIRARDGRDLPVWLTLPAGRQPGQPGPAVVMVHGGPWVRGGHWQWEPMAQFLASRGYLVISPEFRGSRGYGQAHFRAGWKQWGQAMQDDVADALLWAQKQGLANDQVCIAGASYGGYATLMGLVRHPELYRCGVAWVAVTDPFLFLEGSFWINDDISSAGRRHTLPELVGDPKADAEMLTAVSPLAQAARIRAPLLLAFGESDLRVPLAHGRRLREALREAGREPEWVTYPNEGHGWRLPETRTDFAQRVEAFLARHLQPAPPAKP